MHSWSDPVHPSADFYLFVYEFIVQNFLVIMDCHIHRDCNADADADAVISSSPSVAISIEDLAKTQQIEEIPEVFREFKSNISYPAIVRKYMNLVGPTHFNLIQKPKPLKNTGGSNSKREFEARSSQPRSKSQIHVLGRGKNYMKKLSSSSQNILGRNG